MKAFYARKASIPSIFQQKINFAKSRSELIERLEGKWAPKRKQKKHDKKEGGDQAVVAEPATIVAVVSEEDQSKPLLQV